MILTVINKPTKLVAWLFLLAVMSGCPVGLNRVPGSTENRIEPETGRKYQLYVPSWHTNDRRWPLVVTCHGTEPWDTYNRQLREWRVLAERVGFLVAAPRLKGTDGIRAKGLKRQLRDQRADEKLILNTVREMIRSLNADPDRVYIVGWSGGGYAVYHTGLRNPSVFRAAAIRMGKFKENYLPDLAERIDLHQPVAIFFGASDHLPGINHQTREAHKYLKSLGMKRLKLKEIAGGHSRRPDVAFDFFKTATQEFTYVRASAVTGVTGDPLAVQFYLKIDPGPKRVWWDFGDQTGSEKLSPRHVYSKSGTYPVSIKIVTARTARTERQMTITVGK